MDSPELPTVGNDRSPLLMDDTYGTAAAGTRARPSGHFPGRGRCARITPPRVRPRGEEHGTGGGPGHGAPTTALDRERGHPGEADPPADPPVLRHLPDRVLR